MLGYDTNALLHVRNNLWQIGFFWKREDWTFNEHTTESAAFYAARRLVSAKLSVSFGKIEDLDSVVELEAREGEEAIQDRR